MSHTSDRAVLIYLYVPYHEPAGCCVVVGYRPVTSFAKQFSTDSAL